MKCLNSTFDPFRESPKYFEKHVPGIYDRGFCLGLIDLPDSAAGMRRYHKYLELQDEQDPKRKEELYRKYCRGWIVASKEYKKERQKEISNDYPDVEWEGVGMSDLKEAKWESLLKKELKSLGKNQKEKLMCLLHFEFLAEFFPIHIPGIVDITIV